MAVKAIIFTIVGVIALGLGIVGVAVPVMPTTPFVIVSVICFTAGNKKLAVKLEQSRFFGEFIQNYRKKTGITRRAKLISLAVLWAGLTISIIITHTVLVCVILSIVGTCVSAHILKIKTKTTSEGEEDNEKIY